MSDKATAEIVKNLNDENNEITDFDLIIFDYERRSSLMLGMQFLVFAGIIIGILSDPDIDAVSSDGAFMIVLGVVGIGIARWKMTNLKEEYFEHTIGANISRALLLGMSAATLHDPETDDRKNKLEANSNAFFEITRLRKNAKASVKRIDKMVSRLWVSELFFIVAGTLYSGFGKEILIYFRLVTESTCSCGV